MRGYYVKPPAIEGRLLVAHEDFVDPGHMGGVVQEVWPDAEFWTLSTDMVVSMAFTPLEVENESLATTVCRIVGGPVSRV